MNANYELPWKLSFSYARALQREPMAIWNNRPENVPAAQAALIHRAKMNGLASMGLWTEALEGEAGSVITVGMSRLGARETGNSLKQNQAGAT